MLNQSIYISYTCDCVPWLYLRKSNIVCSVILYAMKVVCCELFYPFVFFLQHQVGMQNGFGPRSSGFGSSTSNEFIVKLLVRYCAHRCWFLLPHIYYIYIFFFFFAHIYIYIYIFTYIYTYLHIYIYIFTYIYIYIYITLYAILYV